MNRVNSLVFSTTAFLLCAQAYMHAETLTVTQTSDTTSSAVPGELRTVMNTILNRQVVGPPPSGLNWLIDFSTPGPIVLTAPLPMVNLFSSDTVTFMGNGVTINGHNVTRGFFVRQGPVTFQDMTIENCLAQGGNGGAVSGGGGGGGGLGAGGALFIDQGNVSLQNVAFQSNSATGGNGGTGVVSAFGGNGGGGGIGGSGGSAPSGVRFASGGGGGYAGNGGTGSGNAGGGGGGCGMGSSLSVGGGGGGGGAIIGADGGTSTNPGTGITGFVFGGGGAGVFSGVGTSGGGTNPGTGSVSGGGGGGGFNGTNASGTNGGNGGIGGGGGGGGGTSGTAGNGGVGAGGGGANAAQTPGAGGYGGGTGGGGGGNIGSGPTPPTAGFGGGGGGAPSTGTLAGGNGGFGGGGGGGGFPGGNGGFGGGGAGSGGSGGAGGGNAISATGGGGAGLGAVVFVNSGGTLNVGTGCTITGTNTVTGGSGASTGIAAGGLFFVSGSTFTPLPGLNNTLTISDPIADDNVHTLTGAGNTQPGNGSGFILTMSSPGTLALTATNSTYAGGTVINAGTVSMADDASLGKLGTQVTLSGGTLLFANSLISSRPIAINSLSFIDDGGNLVILSGALSGSGVWLKDGAGTLTLSNAGNNFSGMTTISAGTLQTGASHVFPATTILTINPGATLNIGNSTAQTINQINTSASGTITIGTSGSLTTGAFTNTGTVTMGSASGLSTGAFTNSDTVIMGPTATINAAGLFGTGGISIGSGGYVLVNFSGTDTYSGLISGLGAMIFETGTFSIPNTSNSYSGGTQINSGILQVGSVDTLGASGTNLTFNGNGTLQFTSDLTFARPVIITAAGTIDVGNNAVVFSGSITGSQGFTLSGTGSLTLNNTNNTYGGTTTIPIGTSLLLGGADVLSPNSILNLGTGVTFNLNNLSQSIEGLEGSGNVSLGSATLTLGANFAAYSGVISGSGGLIINGFTPAAVQTYTGPTLIQDGGTLDPSVNNAIPFSSSVTLNGSARITLFDVTGLLNNLSSSSSSAEIFIFSSANPALLTLDGTLTTTYSGFIRGNSDLGVIKQGTGSILFTNNNSSYVGGTQFNGGTVAINALDLSTTGPLGNPTQGTLTFNGGTLEISVDGYTTSKPVVLAGPGTIEVDPSFTSTFNTGFTGSGSFTKSGGGTLFLADSLHTGNTFITAGTLESLTNDTFLFSPSLTVSSPGIFNVNGTLQQVNSLAGNGDVNVGGGQFTLFDSTNNTFSGNIRNTGTFVKTGVATFTLANGGSINLTGGSSSVLLEDGIFTVDGNVTADTITIEGGTLKGTGTLTSPNVISVNDGGVAPGDSPGDLTIVGSMTFSQDTFLAIDLNTSISSELIGTVSIDVTDATLVINAEPGMYVPAMIYDIVSAPTVSGQFDGVEVTRVSATRNFSVNYFPDLIQLEVSTVPFSAVFPNPCSSNAAATANAYETSDSNDPDVTFISGFLHEANGPQLFCDFDQMQLALFNAIPITQESATTAMRTIYTDRLQEIHGPYCALKEPTVLPHLLDALPAPSSQTPKKTRGIWIAPFDNFSRQSSRLAEGECDQTKIGFHSSTDGILMGIDGEVGGKNGADHVILGAAVSYAYTELHWKQSQAHAHASTYLGTLYGSFFYKAFYLNAIVMGGAVHFDAKRHIFLENTLGSLTRTAKHANNAIECEGHLEIGFLWNPGCVQFRPYGSFDYIYLHEDKYREKGAQSLDLIVRARTSKFQREELGLSFSFWQNGRSCSWSPEIKLAYVHEERFRGKETYLRFVDSTDNFTVEGFLPNRNLFAPSASLSIHWPSGFSIRGSYSGEFGEKWSNQTAYVKLLMAF